MSLQYKLPSYTNLGDLELSTISVLVDLHDVYIIKRIVPRLCVAPFVLPRQHYPDEKQQEHT
jgi:hypothetical protein